MMTNDFNCIYGYSHINFCIDHNGYRIPDSVSYRMDDKAEYLIIEYNYYSSDSHRLYFHLMNVTGDIYTGSFYFVNPENKKYYTINYTVEPVDEYKETEYVGEEDILILLGNTTAGRAEFDIGKAMEVLGIEDESSLANAEWQASRSGRSAFLYANAGYDEAKGGFPFDAEGCLDTDGKNTAFHVGYVRENGKHSLACSAESVLENGMEYTTRLALDYGDKRYVFRIKIVNESIDTAINGIKKEQKSDDNIVYDLCGRMAGKGNAAMNELKKGIYILNGKKFAVR
ncbi:MAG: hypothetical protein NC206_10655 [Bacteroides sp.]|nr:hypothetical protein [Roseburia sp.]MCM1347528.1 hypothetical protein [Bacteroides sp.]MCM1419865.1 hypothetical protein [Bacteroides sp.]